MNRLVFAFGLLLAAALMGCGGHGVSFNLVNHQKLDEGEIIIRRIPEQIQSLSATRLSMNNSGKICVYNPVNGQLVRTFSPNRKFDDSLKSIHSEIDSLAGKRYVPLDSTDVGEGVFSNKSKVVSYCWANNRFYIMYQAAVAYYYETREKWVKSYGEPDSESRKQSIAYAQREDIDPKEQFFMSGNIYFLITDSLFRLERAEYFDDTNLPRSPFGRYITATLKGICVYHGVLYTPAHNRENMFFLPYEMILNTKDSICQLVKFDFGKKLKFGGEVLNSYMIPDFKVNARDNLSNSWNFWQDDNILYVKTPMGFYRVNDHTRIEGNPILDKNDKWFSDFAYKQKENLLLCNILRNDYIKSDTAILFRLYDLKTQQVLFDTTMTGGGYFSATGNNYYFVNRDKENYYIDTYQLHTQ
ncbi:MAG: hypothetical protein MUC87_15435 [Bacteroidia bacterium]|jgi:hypothetical protein|nr:hypothetical protein [Bacteroidia bacterium]